MSAVEEDSAAEESDPVPAPGASLKAAPAWRREPYRLFFPLGVLLAWAGVGHWLLLAAFGIGTYSSIFHSIAQIQGFLMAFATGFLFTGIPRRTQTDPPAAWEMAIGLVAPIGTTVAAYAGAIAVAQGFWGASVLVLIAFIARRFLAKGAGRRPPNSFVWLPLAFLIAIAGAALIGAQRGLGEGSWWLHSLGQALILQGMFLALIVGVGGMVIPLLTCGDAPPDGQPCTRDRLIKAGNVFAALVLVASFVVEQRVDPRAGFALRAAVVLLLLLFVAKIWRLPRVPGWHRWLVWLSAWCLPIGYALAAVDMAWKQAGLHVVFIGGFGLMALSVGLHVSLAHGGYQRMVRGRPWQVPFFGGLILVAVVARVLQTLDPARLWWYMGIAASAFLVGTLFWFLLVLPRMWTPAGPEEEV